MGETTDKGGNRARLNKRTVEGLALPSKGSRLVWDTSLTGFGVRLSSGGVRAYVAQARVAGKTRRVTLGRHGHITAETARQRARTELGRMSDGTDPSAERQRERALSVTLAQVADQYKRDRDIKPSTQADVDKAVNNALAPWKDQPISSITRDKVLQRFRTLKDKGPTQANLAFRILRSLYNYAHASYRDTNGEPLLGENPVNVLSEAKLWAPNRSRNDYVPLDRLGKWWSAVQARRHDSSLEPAQRAAIDLVAFMAVTGMRPGEARPLRWDQVDLDDGSVRLSDTKNRSEVTLPLSSVALAILRGREDAGAYVFAGRAGGHIKECRGALDKVREQSGVAVKPHDLRKTFSRVAGEVGVELWRAKALMNHKFRQDVTLNNYTDLEDVRYLRPQAEAIADYFERQRLAYETNNVVTLHGRAAQ